MSDTTTSLAPVDRALELEVVRMEKHSLFSLARTYLMERKGELAPSSIARIEAALKAFERFILGRPLTRELLAQFRDHLALSRKGRGGSVEWDLLKPFLQWLTDNGYLPKEVYKGIRPPPRKEPMKRLAIQQEHYAKIMGSEKTKPVIRWLTRLMYHTGLAITDASELSWNEVDMDRLVITKVRRKTRNFRQPCLIPIIHGGELHQALQERWDEAQKEKDVWPNINGRWMVSPEAYLAKQNQHTVRWWKQAIRDCGLADYYKPHGCRKGFVTRLANGSMNPAMAMKITGHTDPKVFAGYVENDPEPLREQMMEALEREAERRNKR